MDKEINKDSFKRTLDRYKGRDNINNTNTNKRELTGKQVQELLANFDENKKLYEESLGRKPTPRERARFLNNEIIKAKANLSKET
jgi:hypothetical protein